MIKVGCTGKGLKMAIEHAFEELEKDNADGFKYPIGEINGSPIYITWERKDARASYNLIEFDPGGLTFGAVWEDNDAG